VLTMPVMSCLQDIFEGSENYNHFTAKYPILDVCTVFLTLEVRIMPRIQTSYNIQAFIRQRH